MTTPVQSAFDRIVAEAMTAVDHVRFKARLEVQEADKIFDATKLRLETLKGFAENVNDMALGKLGHILIGPEPIKIGERGAEYVSLRASDHEVRIAEWHQGAQVPPGYYRAIVLLQPVPAPANSRR